MTDDVKIEYEAKLFILGREFTIGPDEEGEQFDFKQQLFNAKDELNRDLAALLRGTRLEWMRLNDEIPDQIEHVRSQHTLLDTLIDQVVGIRVSRQEVSNDTKPHGEPEYIPVSI